jgi:carbamoyl-phosphate synthase large subunit
MANILECETSLRGIEGTTRLTKELLTRAKRLGFSDERIAEFVGSRESSVRAARDRFGIRRPSSASTPLPRSTPPSRTICI